MDFGIATVLSLTILAYLAGQIAKATNLDNRWIPIICGLTGLVLGVLSYYIGMIDFPAQDPITAAAVGVASGLAATGANQIYKQLSDK